MGGHSQVTVTPIQPYQARKDYLCPGCQGIIPKGTFHLVVVPDETPDLRRHWHRGCWYKDQRRRFGSGTPVDRA
ncbi:MAG: hypothetical protein L0Z49_03170 [Actinobacteria bacterium]|nr:hypothetical protein [Actinomycetota bacterium]MCI0543432.1 hypothetical protein [Actinomycetota bacterium]